MREAHEKGEAQCKEIQNDTRSEGRNIQGNRQYKEKTIKNLGNIGHTYRNAKCLESLSNRIEQVEARNSDLEDKVF